VTSKNILITGGAGSLGVAAVEFFLGQGCNLLVLDNFETGHRDALVDSDRLQVVEGSITDANVLGECFQSFEPTHVIHSAASYKDPSDWQTDIEVNCLATATLAKLCRKFSVKRLVNFQTSLCYGAPNIVPIPVSHPCNPFTSYGISKLAGEQFLLNSGLDVVSLRLANVTGPRLSIGPIPTFYQRLKEGKSCFCTNAVRDFVDMSDFLEILSLSLQEDAPLGIFNVSTGEGTSIKKVFDTVAAHLDVKLEEPVRTTEVGDDDVQSLVLDPSQTIKQFNWEPTFKTDETLERMLKWYDANGVSKVYSHLAPR